MDQTVEARNNSSKRVESFKISASSGFSFAYGALSPTIWATHCGSVRIKSKDICEVSWVDTYLRSHTVSLDMKKEFPQGITEGIRFILNEDGTITASKRVN